MSESLRPFLSCQNCEKQMLLPHSTQEGIPISQIGWPSDRWRRNFLCLECGHVYVYLDANVHWEISLPQIQDPQLSDEYVVSVEIPCATEGCSTPVRVHVIGNVWPINRKVIARLGFAEFHGVRCSYGHPSVHQELLHGEPGRDFEWWKSDL